jgi:hypothetical protein
MEASDYLASVEANFPRALGLQSIPPDEELWRIENYPAFLAARRKMLATELNAFLSGITPSTQPTAPASIDDLIADGESDGLEFKSSLLWDYRQECPNRKLQDVILKSVAAFANARGGTLLIGVSDEGGPLGLERDYAALNIPDRDKFELHLRNLFSKAFGVAFMTAKIRVSFPVVCGTEICAIDVSAAPKPIVLKLAERDGQALEKFYVRSGNSSREMPMSEMHAYVSDRFP